VTAQAGFVVLLSIGRVGPDLGVCIVAGDDLSPHRAVMASSMGDLEAADEAVRPVNGDMALLPAAWDRNLALHRAILLGLGFGELHRQRASMSFCTALAG
jgi:hypothetical protein